MIDTHTHLNFDEFKDDYAEIIESGFKDGLKSIINIGVDLTSSQRAIDIGQKFENCYASVGWHPLNIKDRGFSFDELKNLIKQNKHFIKGIGETGLDFFYNDGVNEEEQKQIFIKHLNLAEEFKLPLIIHCRGANNNPQKPYTEILNLIKKNRNKKGVCHCFSGDQEIAEEFLGLGFYIGLTGIITFKNISNSFLSTIKEIPLDRILLETDSPYLAPEPHRGKRNQPINVRYVALKIASIKNISFDEVVKQTTQNAQRLFDIKL